MRSPRLLVALAAACVPAAAGAQIQVSPRSFEPAVAPWVGITSFGIRHRTPIMRARYRNSIAAGAQLQVPVTRRVGFLVNGSVAPFARQRTEGEGSTQIEDEAVVAYRADVALAWRFKPAAPVFLFGGGGVVGASKPAFPGFGGGAADPAAAFGFGLDRPGPGRWAFRAVYAGYLVFPSVPSGAWEGSGDALAVTARSSTFDWTIQVGGRYTLGAR